MPTYSYRCGSCGDERDYSISKVGALPQRCLNCEYSGDDFQRIWANEGFSIGGESGRDENQISKIDLSSGVKGTLYGHNGLEFFAVNGIMFNAKEE